MKRTASKYKIIKMYCNECFEICYELTEVWGFTYPEYPQLFIYDDVNYFKIIDIVTGLTIQFYKTLLNAERGLEECYNTLLNYKDEFPDIYIKNVEWGKLKLKELDR